MSFLGKTDLDRDGALVWRDCCEGDEELAVGAMRQVILAVFLLFPAMPLDAHPLNVGYAEITLHDREVVIALSSISSSSISCSASTGTRMPAWTRKSSRPSRRRSWTISAERSRSPPATKRCPWRPALGNRPRRRRKAASRSHVGLSRHDAAHDAHHQVRCVERARRGPHAARQAHR